MERCWFFLILLTMTSWSSLTKADQCDCTIWPFAPDPPCFDQCATPLLLEGDIEMLQEKLNLSPKTLEAVRSARRHKAAGENVSLSEIFDVTAENEIETRLRALDEQDIAPLLQNSPMESFPVEQ